MEKKMLSPREVESVYGVPQKTLANWRWDRSGPQFVKVKQKVYYRISDLDDFFEKHLIKTIN